MLIRDNRVHVLCTSYLTRDHHRFSQPVLPSHCSSKYAMVHNGICHITPEGCGKMWQHSPSTGFLLWQSPAPGKTSMSNLGVSYRTISPKTLQETVSKRSRAVLEHFCYFNFQLSKVQWITKISHLHGILNQL